MKPSGNKRAISRVEWPEIVRRRENGETYVAIGRDYSVTGPAIKYIVDKAQSDTSVYRAMKADGNMPASAAESHVKLLPKADDLNSADNPVKTRSELSRRLVETTQVCAKLFDRLTESGQDATTDQDVKDALHQVRRAVSAIEIAMIRGIKPQSHKDEDIAPEAKSSGRGESPEPVPFNEVCTTQTSPSVVSQIDGVIEGTVKFFKPERGFGFVQPRDGGKDIYVPAQVVQRAGIKSMESGKRVWVSVTAGSKGPEAERIGISDSC